MILDESTNDGELLHWREEERDSESKRANGKNSSFFIGGGANN